MRNHWLDKWEDEQELKNEEYEERAAIMQYEANMTKENAEQLALKIVAQKYPALTLRS